MRKRRIGIALELAWPFRRHLDVFAGTQQYAKDNHPGWLFEIDEFIHERLRPARGKKQAYDGLIARVRPELAETARRAGVPLVNVWFNSPVRDELPGVLMDPAATGRIVAEHLLERGFRNFGCLGVTRQHSSRVMSEAFHAAIRSSGCRCTCTHTEMRYYATRQAWTRFQEILDAWIDTFTPPMALLVTLPDVTSRYVVNACRRRGLKVPEDVALITSSNEPHINLMPPPSLSSVEINYHRLGYRAASMLDQLIRGKRLPQKHEFISPAGIIARDSTDYFAVEDSDVAAAMRFIEKNLSRKIGVADVAAVAGSRRTLERRFRETCGRSIASEIRRLRVLKAKRLLSETGMLVKQVAKEAGFGDPIRLHEVFVREVGMAPSAYREKSSEGA